MVGAEVLGRSRRRVEGLGVQARGGDRLPLEAAELGELEGFGRVGGLVLPLEDRGEPILQGDQSLAAPELGEDVGSQLMILGEPVEATAGRGLGLAESPQGQQRLAQRAACAMKSPGSIRRAFS